MKRTDPKFRHVRPPYSDSKFPPPGKTTELHPVADYGEATYTGSNRLADRKILITGGDSGIGRAVAIAFAREGADVAISYLSEHEDAKETARWVTNAGRKAVLLPGNIAKSSVCDKIARKAIESLGRIDILVNNAAYQRSYGAFEDIPPDEFEQSYKVNVFAMFRLCKFLLPRMKPGGSIINTASIQSYDPSPGLIAYASTKSAIASFTNSLAAFAIKQGIRVNAVAPGPVWTPLIPSTLPKKKVKQFGTNTIYGRAAQPAEIAPLFVFLASDDASYMSGEIVGITGGRMPI